MTNLLLLVAVLGMVIGAYAVAMPTLARKGWRLPFASFFSDADEGDDIEFKTPFEMPRATDAPLVTASPSVAPVEEVVPLPPVLRPEDLDEDDPTLTPLFEDLVAEVEAQPLAVVAPEGAPADQAAPHLVLVHGQPEGAEALENAAPEPLTEEPKPEAKATDGNDMMALFEESSDAGKGPNLVREISGDVSITDLMEEVRKLRDLLDIKRAA
jgi:hypothetical protein